MCFKVVELCNQFRIPCALENPRGSLMFLLPELNKLFEKEHGQTHENYLRYVLLWNRVSETN